MRRKIKGFTLIECIVALAILGVASLTMAQIYANVAKRNRDNHLVNTSLSNQMAYVEQATGAEAVQILYTGASSTQPPHNNSSITQYVKIENTCNSTTYTYSYPVDIYVLRSRDAATPTNEFGLGSNDPNYSGASEDNYNLRYKYLLGH